MEVFVIIEKNLGIQGIYKDRAEMLQTITRLQRDYPTRFFSWEEHTLN